MHRMVGGGKGAVRNKCMIQLCRQKQNEGLFFRTKRIQTTIDYQETIRPSKIVHSGNRIKPMHPSPSESPSERTAPSIINQEDHNSSVAKRTILYDQHLA